ncbi:hypothetical protein [Glycomyces buryatensis]|uniref:Uncharacterized protein n=1 Tax=Glycomyces buryatensis TaxID=2570927 RepID=A0A4S8QNG7_9ACTN|nr:hypothetical protein [Glycomyces buryatensis]THV42264.1 hypothetical protein FAB82_07235 [Glycomyces buryatensis]
MSDSTEVTAENYSGLGTDEGGSTASYLNPASCDHGDCQNGNDPAEEQWVKLVSAVPVSGQVESFVCVAEHGIAAPSQEEVQQLVGEIRGPDGDKHALRTIGEAWSMFRQDFAIKEDTAVEPILKTELTKLSDGWQGDDFDGFAEQMATVFANCEQIKNDLGDESTGLIGLLFLTSDSILALQGGDSRELPYPAPKYWIEDKGNIFTDPKVHMRAPFATECEISSGCKINGDQSVEESMSYGGYDGEYTDELNDYVTDQTEVHYAQLKSERITANLDALPDDATDKQKEEAGKLTDSQDASVRAEAERLAQQDGNERAEQDYDSESESYENKSVEQNNTVTARWEDAETYAGEFTPTVEPARDTTFRESGSDLGAADYNGTESPSFSSPSGNGSAGLVPPENPTGFGGSGGTGGGGTGGIDSGGLDDSNPWDNDSSDDDDLGGGLASGGPTATLPSTGTGGGGGMPGGTPGGGGGGAPAGLFGPAAGGGGMGAGGAGRGGGMGGKGAGAGAGKGLFGKAAGGAGAGAGRGAGGGMMGGGRGGPGTGEGEEAGKETWLLEDEDIWGLARFEDDNDPLA